MTEVNINIKKNEEKVQADMNKIDIRMVGSKGLFLRDMFNAKVLVPPGFIMASIFEQFMEGTGLYARINTIMDASGVSLSDMNSILQASNEIVNLINNIDFPKELETRILNEFSKLKAEYVAVRPSFVIDGVSSLSLAREFPSQLNVNRDILIKSIKRIWATSFSPASIAYRLEKNIDMKRPLVVLLIQKMIDAEVSGVCFTSHPITKDRKQIVVEASFGLNEEVNTKGIARDTYIVDKNNWKILGKTIFPQKTMLTRVGSTTNEVEVGSVLQTKQKLSNAQILSLANLAKRVEDIYDRIPQKIEWALEKNNFYIIESQPISKA
ncbi:MAG: PEP/pyruvate-binding domain-containing protein [Parcubacteria group bacterium]|nr:PEP/pyruvate-binding domain-containing protein [Parcubacteria group bacterium]MCR4342688.1 PEP/pyruvate-binding domain-containing protein [Patescibacteria group bacterium]